LDSQLSRSSEANQALDTEYRYIVHMKASETFRNVMRREGITIPEGANHISFTSDKRLDMKGYKERGLTWSYTVIRVRTEEDVIEED